MKNKSFFEKFKNSIYNIREFPNYIREGVGKAILYALILSIILGGIKGITTTFTLNKDINLAIQTLEDDKYKFKIENGTLDLVTSPLKIENGSTLIYLDENKDISQSEELKNITVHLDSYILILKDGIVTNSEVMLGFSQAKYSDFLGGMIITNDNIVETLRLSSKFIYVIIPIITILETFMTLIMDALIIGIMLLLTNFIFKLGLRFSQLFSLAIYAATLPAILILILNIIVPNVYLDSVRVLGTFLYSFIVLRNMRSEIDENMNIQ
ncbi:DUF1189 family protein [Clostridium sp.]|uniref:DUF1189 family protein n=1 Tax=Clostridium sp. TaxID=1506 RepID=UPI001DDC90B2|nr:DUF1189 family protein [Clostridium sp.]MBS5986266.1 DUF1189 domain-containing protein [Clostridium sp.]